MTPISLTLYVDALLAPSARRAAVVRGHHREPYDVYAPFKDAAVALACRRVHSEAFTARMASLDPRRRDLYAPLADGFLEFLRSKPVEGCRFFAPSPVLRQIEGAYGLQVNPELGYTNGTSSVVVKLWCRTEPLEQPRVELTCAVLQIAHHARVPGVQAAMLEVRTGRLHTAGKRALHDACLVVETHARAYTELFERTERRAAERAA